MTTRPQVRMQALMTITRLGVGRCETFMCGTQEARDQEAAGRAVRANPDVEPAAPDLVAAVAEDADETSGEA